MSQFCSSLWQRFGYQNRLFCRVKSFFLQCADKSKVKALLSSELLVYEELKSQGHLILAVGDAEVRKFLSLSRKQKAPDFLTLVPQGRFGIYEVKSGIVDSHAIEQLVEAAEALGRRQVEELAVYQVDSTKLRSNLQVSQRGFLFRHKRAGGMAKFKKYKIKLYRLSVVEGEELNGSN